MVVKTEEWLLPRIASRVCFCPQGTQAPLHTGQKGKALSQGGWVPLGFWREQVQETQPSPEMVFSEAALFIGGNKGYYINLGEWVGVFMVSVISQG